MKNINLNDPVWQIATTKVTTVSAKTSIEEVRNIFDLHNFHHLPVLDKDGLLKGIISATDLVKVEKLMALYQFKKNSPKFTAEIIMTAYPYSLHPDDAILVAIELFLDNRFHALPIVENGILKGIVTTHDIIELTYNCQN